jgi:hypothetical protein
MTYIGKKPENITASVNAPSGTFSGEVDAGSLDISGNADIDGTLEADAITINGTAIASVLSPIAGSSSIVTTGALNAGSITSGFGNIDTGSSTITTTGAITGGSLVIDNITIDGTEIDLSSGDITLDAALDIKLDAAGGDIKFLSDGTEFGEFRNISNDLVLISSVNDKDIVFKGQDNNSEITALTLDMSDAGKAIFTGDVQVPSINGGQIGGRRNIIINGAMQIAQRGTSVTGLGASGGFFTVDRFKMDFGQSDGRFTMSQSTDAPEGFGNSIKLACTTADTSIGAGEIALFQHMIEGQDLQQFKKGTSNAEKMTLSFYVKGNGNATYVYELYDNDNGRQISKTFSVTSSWTRVVLTYDGDTTGAFDNDNGLSLYAQIWLHAGSNYTSGTLSTTWTAQTAANRAVGISSFYSSTDNEFYITGLQLEVGSQATPFEHRHFSDQLRDCQRYYVRAGGANYANIFGTGGIANTTGSWFGFGNIPVPMRTGFTLILSGGTPRIQNGQAGFNASSVSASQIANQSFPGSPSAVISMGCNASGLTLYRWHNMDAGASAALFELDAEL